MRHLTVIILAIGLCACSNSSDKKVIANDNDSLQNLSKAADTIGVDGNDFFKLESYLDSDPVDTTKVQPIDYKCALLIYPNEKQIEEMKKEYGEDFFTIADDGNYYQGTAIGLLDSLKIKTISANKPFIRFIGTNKTWTLNLTRKGLPAWNLIFFARNKEPEIIGTAGLTTEKVNEFFQRAE